MLTEELETRAIRMTKYLRYYSSVCFNFKLLFIVGVISHDIRVICETAFAQDSGIHDQLLQIFLTSDDGSDGSDERALPDVRKAQVILATFYLVHKKPNYAQKIRNDFSNDSYKNLWMIMKELQNVSHRELWEVSERGTNFNWTSKEQKDQIPVFLSEFKNFTNQANPLNPQERKKFDRLLAQNDFS